MSCKIIDVQKNSIADELGIKKGCELLFVSGEKPHDYIDYKYLINSECIELTIKMPDNTIENFEIEKNFDDDFGLIFESAIFDKIKTCANNCIFCFVDQQPKGLRKSLYIKDDDFRLSYLQGTYVTLTNLTKKDKERISSLHLGPLYVSVHTTNPELRIKMLQNKRAANILKELDFLKQNEIPIHSQIVLCPGFNDGTELIRTLNDLYKYKKIIKSIAVVPVGITKFRQKKLTAVSQSKAIETIGIIDDFNKKIKKNLACASDEFFLIANKEIPKTKYYNGFLQLDDGVGALRYLTDDFNKRILKSSKKLVKEKKEFTIVCSESAKNVFFTFKDELNRIENVNIDIKPVKCAYWGRDINVAGLITAGDIIKQLENNCFYDVFIPSVMLRAYTLEFLDGLSVKDIENKLSVKIHIVQDILTTKEIFDYIFSKS